MHSICNQLGVSNYLYLYPDTSGVCSLHTHTPHYSVMLDIAYEFTFVCNIEHWACSVGLVHPRRVLRLIHFLVIPLMLGMHAGTSYGEWL